jgi:hypothetical protein
LDTFAGRAQEIKLENNGEDLMLEPIPVKLLPAQYEVGRYNQNLTNDLGTGFVKNQLFDFDNNLEWGEIYLLADPYIDTYFSLVTETYSHGASLDCSGQSRLLPRHACIGVSEFWTSH